MMTTELYWLTLTCLFTSVLWVPYILNRLAVRGMPRAMGNPQSDDKPHSDWADRAMRAHGNAVENLVIFGLLVLIAHVVDANTSLTATAAMIYFFSRVVHYAIYLAGIPFLRTIVFAVCWAMQIVFVFAILAVA